MRLRLDQRFIRDGINVNSVSLTGADSTTLRIDYALCSRVFMARFAGSVEAQQSLRGLGFRRVECKTPIDRTTLDL